MRTLTPAGVQTEEALCFNCAQHLAIVCAVTGYALSTAELPRDGRVDACYFFLCLSFYLPLYSFSTSSLQYDAPASQFETLKRYTIMCYNGNGYLGAIFSAQTGLPAGSSDSVHFSHNHGALCSLQAPETELGDTSPFWRIK
ncbi:uncharacterized [Tachysurus ichikawai]